MTTNLPHPRDENVLYKNVSRRRLLRLAVAGGGATLAGAIMRRGATADVDEAKAAGTLTLEVALDLDSFDTVRTPVDPNPMPTGPFFVRGAVYPEGTLDSEGDPGGATSIGAFRCWGWTYDGSTGDAVVSQIFDVTGRGEIHVQGVEVVDLTRAVTGGTGEFNNVRGEVTFQYFPNFEAFTTTFHLWQQVLLPLVINH